MRANLSGQPNLRTNTPNAVPAGGARLNLKRWLPIRRAVVESNLQRAFGSSLNELELDRLAAAFYRHLLLSFGEYLTSPFLSAERHRARVTIEGREIVLDAMTAGRGVLLLTGHLGNWEIACADGVQNFTELKGRLHVIRRPIRPAWLDRYVRERFHRSGIGTIPKKDSMPEILRHVAANDVVGFVIDQHTASAEAVRTTFFGSPCWTSRSLAIVARRTGAPVIPFATWREPDGTHAIKFEPALKPATGRDLHDEIRANTQLYNDTLEQMIRRHPEQWNWIHRRWKEAR